MVWDAKIGRRLPFLSFQALSLGAAFAAICAPAAAAGRTVQALRTEEAIVLDGTLDEGAWRRVEPAGSFIQSEPRQGQPSSEATEVRILFDADNLYFGVICSVRDRGDIVANSLRVDFSPADEDIFEILLDPFASARDGFLFITNPHGAKRDEQISNGGRESNVSWDGAWDVRTRIGSDGWTAEIRIPLRTLRYEKGQQRSWKVNFGRQIRRHNEVAYWSEIPRQFNIRQVSLAGEMVGLSQERLQPGRNLLVTPYLLASAVDRAAKSDAEADFGADVKYGLTPSLTLDLTYNTDFSHVEVDQQQVNLDRFRLSFPEKRDFFLENEGIFEVGSVRLQSGMPDPEDPTVFYSRNIGLSSEGRPVPILGGGRLTGRIGRYSLGLMSIETGEGEDQGGENATVLRAKRDLLARSYIGGFFLSRSGLQRLDNRVYGVDGLYRPRNDLTFNSYFAKSQTSGVEGDDWARRLEWLYDSRRLMLGATHTNVQEDYRDDLGFILRKGVLAERLEVRPRVRPWEGKAIREIQPVLNIRYVSDLGRRLLSREQSIGVDFSFQNGAFLRLRRRNYFERLDENFQIRRGIFIPVADYHFDEQGVEFNTDRSRALSGSMKWYDGDFWNGEKRSWQAGGTFRPNARLRAEVNFSQDRVRLPAGPFTASLSRLRLQYSFNTVAFLDALVQYNSERHSVTSNIRFNWIHRPLSDLFLVYTEERATLGRTETERVFSIKYTHLLSF